MKFQEKSVSVFPPIASLGTWRRLRLPLAVIVAVSALCVALLPAAGGTRRVGAAAPHRVVIFVSGLGSSLAGTAASGSCGGGWQTFETALARDGFACGDYLLYSYTGGTVDGSGAWHPSPFSCYDTGNHVATSVGKLVALMTSYRAAHPDVQFVLIGHSLGGLIALQAPAHMPAGAVAAVVTIDSPLKDVSRRNLANFTKLIGPYASLAGCSSVLWNSDAVRDIATIHNKAGKKQAASAAASLVKTGQANGARYMTVGNKSDCLWKPAACKIRGSWSDDSSTMTVKAADSSKLYPLGTGGCNLSNVINKKGQVQLRNLPEIVCIGISHGLALQDQKSVIPDIVRFVGASPVAHR